MLHSTPGLWQPFTSGQTQTEGMGLQHDALNAVTVTAVTVTSYSPGFCSLAALEAAPPQAHSSGASSEQDVSVGPPCLLSFPKPPGFGVAETPNFWTATRPTRDCHLSHLPAMGQLLALTMSGSTPGLLQPGTSPWQSVPGAQRQLGKGAGPGVLCHTAVTVSWGPLLPARLQLCSHHPALPTGPLEDG